MTTRATECVLRMIHEEEHDLESYQGSIPRWCNGCGDNAILAAVQRLCRDENLRPEKTVFVSGIGCSSRFPHYMKTYGFHGIHGRALPIAEGIKLTRPDLKVFVSTGDGDCCSIGAAHWIHAIRYNMNMTMVLHDNHIYGLTKMQVSPTSPVGLKSKTTPRGAYLDALNPLTVTLGVQNVSFVAQAVDWIPELVYEVLSAAFHHKGFSFVRVIQRCPEFLPKMLDPWLHDPSPRKGLQEPACARSIGPRPGPGNRVIGRSDSGGYSVSQPRCSLLRGHASYHGVAHPGADPGRARGGTRQIYGMAAGETR